MKSKIFNSRALSADLGLLILRIFAGGAMATHGWAKFQKVLGGNLEFGDPIGIGAEASLYLAIFAELVCAILVIIGLATRFAVVPLVITMIVAMFLVHAADPFNIKELAFLYLGIFVSLFFTGPGKLSVDDKL